MQIVKKYVKYCRIRNHEWIYFADLTKIVKVNPRLNFFQKYITIVKHGKSLMQKAKLILGVVDVAQRIILVLLIMEGLSIPIITVLLFLLKCL